MINDLLRHLKDSLPRGSYALGYNYKPIVDWRELRLVSLEPGIGPEPLRCSIVHATYDDQYEAVSYVWGDATPVAHIRVSSSRSGSRILITRNCEAALRCLRRKVHKRLLWVDSICINQADLMERSAEVARMDQIYAQASGVAVYLGPGVFKGVKLLKRLWSAEPHALQPTQAAALSEVRQLFHLPWFTRTWVIQEVHLAKKAALHDDCTAVPWTHLLSAASQLRHGAPAWLSTANDAAEWVKLPIILELELQAKHHNRQHTILEVMERARPCLTTDPRDKIYAFGGICPELTMLSFPAEVASNGVFHHAVSSTRAMHGNLLYGEDHPLCYQDILRFKPSYSLSVEQIVLLFTVCWIKSTGSTEILCAVQSPNTRPGLPSFVADWTTPQQYDVIGCPDMGHLKRPGPSMVDLQIPYTMARVRFRYDAAVLRVRGTAIARVEAVSCSLLGSSRDVETLLQWWEMSGVQLGLQSTFDPAKQDEIFWRTIIADTDVFGNSPSTHTREQLAACRKWLEEARTSLPKGDDDKNEVPKLLPDWIQPPVEHASRGRRFISVQDAMVGIAPPETRIDDVVAVLSGSRVPFILRPVRHGWNEYTLVGECYVHDILRAQGSSRGEMDSSRGGYLNII